MDFRILGPLQVIDDGGRELALTGAKQRALLAVLLLHGNQLVSSDRLIEELWGERAPASAAKALQVHVSRLRRALGDDGGEKARVVTRGGGYVLRIAPGECDRERAQELVDEGTAALGEGSHERAVARFEAALGLWRGEPLADLAYESFAQGEIAGLEELRLVAIEGRIDAEFALGHHAQVIPELERLIESHPFRERLAGQLMLALYRCGRQADALDAYQRTRGRLGDELGLEPGSALKALQSQILEQARSLDAGHGDSTDADQRPGLGRRTLAMDDAPRSKPSAPLPASSSGELLEREAELGCADRVCDQAGSGVGAVLVVEGAAGIGKTGLLAGVRAGVEARGFGVLAARGSEFESEMPFGVARQLFESMLRTASSGERRRLLGGVARVGARALGVVAGDPPADRFAAIHGLFWLCANRVERGPLAVLVDDVQWVDDPSLGWLGYVARRARDLELLLVLALRSGDRGALRGELARLVHAGGVQRLVLGPLSAAAVSAIVRSQLDEDAEEPFCAACWELCGGNPLLLQELLAAARGKGLSARCESVPTLRSVAPAAVGTSVLARLSGLGPEAVALARAVAVLGAGGEVVAAAQLADLDPIVAELTADRLAAAQILAPTRPLEFFHPLIGAAILEEIPPGARRVEHRRAAAIVEREGTLSRVAAHLLASGPAGDRWVVEQLRDAANEALDRGAPEVAANYARRALVEPPAADQRAALLLTLGTAEWRAGQPDAIPHLEQALAAAAGDPQTLVAASFALAPAYAESDRAEHAVDVLERALSVVDGTDSELASTLEAGIAIVGIMNERTAPTALRRAERLRRRLRGAGADLPLYLLVMMGYYAARTNRVAEARELARQALACEPYPPPLDICIFLIGTLTVIEWYDELQRLCQDLVAAARTRGAMQELAAILVFRASAACDRGALADAEADARWTLEHADGAHRMHAASELIRVLIERDSIEEADRELEQWVDPRESRSDEVVRFLIVRGRLRVAQGRLEEALDDFLECGRRCVVLGRITLGAVPWRSEAALVRATLGNIGEARRLAGEQLELARASGCPRALGISLRACGLIEGGETRLELLGAAVQTLERSESPLEFARALSDYGAALRRAGRRVQARPQLERALDLAHHCGARRIAAGARAELVLAGAKPRRDAITGRDALTAGELRVARLAAEGLTNREIAQALFITAKTAKAHLTRVYRKLEITRRGELANALTARLDGSRDDLSATAPIS